MKKTYEKPQIYMERFELAEHIAGCSIYTWNEDGSAKGWIDGDEYTNLFIDGTSACTQVVETYCYTNGSISNATITS